MDKIYKTGFISQLLILIISLLISTVSISQTLEEILIKDLEWRNIGPANMGGRISDIEAVEGDFRTVYCAVGNGGVWKSTNAGTTWEPIFDKYGSSSIGDIAVFRNDPDIIWVGTGEECSRNSVAWGDGIYKSIDGGRTFKNMGLKNTHTIGKILTHPANPDIAYAAAVGHTWGYNDERGLYRTVDGGKNWTLLGSENGLPQDGRTGAVDMVMHPEDPDVIYVSFWERIRFPYRFLSGGPNGGIFKTADGGKTFTELTGGFPEGNTGKIGLAISRSNPDVLMAIVEHGYQPPRELEGGGPNPDFYDLSSTGSGIYRTEDGGKNWKFMNRHNLRPFYYSHIYINPFDDKMVYCLDASFLFSRDGGKTFNNLGENIYLRGDTPYGVHGDHHAMWLDPNNRDRFYIGDDAGIALTHDHSNYILFNNLFIGQLYAVSVDMDEPYNVIGGFQDGQTWRGPSRSRDRAILPDHWFKFGTGDGFYSQSDPENPEIFYYDHQGGSIVRMNFNTRESSYIKPSRRNILNYNAYITTEIEDLQKEKGWNSAFRFNWNTPIVISPHDHRTLYFGGNHLFKSVDMGDSWQIISPDLSTNDPEKTRRESGGLTSDVTSAENYGSITTVSASSISPGLVWIGTDDGNIQLTRNDGTTWENVTVNFTGIPEGLWVSRVEASHFNPGTAYVSFDGHRSDRFSPWIFKTEDFGETWIRVSGNIPEGYPVYVIREDKINPNLLFAGTEFAVFFSINKGETWSRLNKNMPTVAVHDLVIHPRDGDLIAGTHGRGIWILDDITPLQQFRSSDMNEDFRLFESRAGIKWIEKRRGGSMGHLYIEGKNSPEGLNINFFLNETAEVKIEISDLTGNKKYSRSRTFRKGISRYLWDMRFDPEERRIRNFRNRTRRILEQHRDHHKYIKGEEVEPYLDRLESLGNNIEGLLTLTDELIEKFGWTRRNFGSNRLPGFSKGWLTGEEAEPGDYIIRLTVNGKEFSDVVTVREDPLLSKLNR